MKIEAHFPIRGELGRVMRGRSCIVMQLLELRILRTKGGVEMFKVDSILMPRIGERVLIQLAKCPGI